MVLCAIFHALSVQDMLDCQAARNSTPPVSEGALLLQM